MGAAPTSAARKLFGTDGVRGVAGEFLTAELALALARSATARITTDHAPRVLIIRDTRGVVGRNPRGGRAGEREGQFGREKLARDTAHTIGAEELAGGAGGRRAH